jgi:hypothetical protein
METPQPQPNICAAEEAEISKVHCVHLDDEENNRLDISADSRNSLVDSREVIPCAKIQPFGLPAPKLFIRRQRSIDKPPTGPSNFEDVILQGEHSHVKFWDLAFMVLTDQVL